jgi:lipopolysaccharide export system permease protein
MRVLQRYFNAEIARSIFFVLAAFLALFAFFDLVEELKDVGGGYRIQHAFIYLLLRIPDHVYVLLPVAALIGTIWTLAQFAARSEFTIMRVSSMSTWQAAKAMAKIGLVLVVVTFLLGEFIAPFTSDLGERIKLRARGASVSEGFRSGLWAKDVIKENGISGKTIGSRFLNVLEVKPDGDLVKVRIYEFDTDFRLTGMIVAETARYKSKNVWQLTEVSDTRFGGVMLGANIDSAAEAPIALKKMASSELVSEITPEILAVLFVDPERMSASNLAAYTKHLAENKQHTERYEIAYWKKLIYPFAVLVMMALALPFAYLHVRSGGVSLKIFIGIMIGVSFVLLNGLFSHVGLLKSWPPFATAVAPSLFFLLMAMAALIWAERH